MRRAAPGHRGGSDGETRVVVDLVESDQEQVGEVPRQVAAADG
jgi:hypothetical protein